MFSKGSLVVDIVRPLVGRAAYRLGATLSEAPEFFDCSGLIQWGFEAALGIYVPRSTVSQVRRGYEVELSAVRAADLVFTTGRCERCNFPPPHMPNGVGHAG